MGKYRGIGPGDVRLVLAFADDLGAVEVADELEPRVDEGAGIWRCFLASVRLTSILSGYEHC
jgi:hypothetical protein